jgi:hypothetical protein
MMLKRKMRILKWRRLMMVVIEHDDDKYVKCIMSNKFVN